MRAKPFLILCAVLFTACGAFAQMGMDIVLNRGTYMQYEPIFACVTLRNDTGRPLVFGNNPKLQGFLLFEVTDQKGQVMPKRKNAELGSTGLILMPGQIRRLVIPINRFYNVDTPGVYRVHAYISHALLPNEYKTKELKFYVDKGVTVWQRTVGVPELNAEKASEIARKRSYVIRTVIENATQKYFYLFVEDDDMVYAVIRVGKAVGREPFKADVDMLSRIHLLMPISPKVYQYLAFTIEGRAYASEYRKNSDTIPTLVRDPNSGIIRLMGGEEARAGIDYTDPNDGMKTGNELMFEDESDVLPVIPQAPEAPALPKGGMVDLGEKL